MNKSNPIDGDKMLSIKKIWKVPSIFFILFGFIIIIWGYQNCNFLSTPVQADSASSGDSLGGFQSNQTKRSWYKHEK